MRKKIQNTIWGQLSRHAIRFDGEDGGGSSTTTTTPTTEATPASTTTPAKPEESETQPFKSFASEEDYKKDVDFRVQQALKTHEEKLKGKLTPEIRKQLEAEANMTAEQKYQAQLDQLAADKKALAKEKNRIKAESLLVSKGVTDESARATMLDSVVGEDEAESLQRAQALVDAIEKATNEKIKVAMKSVKVPSSGDGDGDGKSKETIGKVLGERRAKVNDAANKTLDFYRYGGKKA